MSDAESSRRHLALRWLFCCLLLVLTGFAWSSTAARPAPPSRVPHLTATLSPAPTVTGTLCVHPTPGYLWVEPVTSPTNALTQTVLIQVSNALTVTVTTESGVFTLNPQPGASQHAITITLLPNTTHELLVTAHVPTTTSGGCVFGGYTLSTTQDRNAAPLTIVHQSGAISTPTQPPIVTPTPTPGQDLGLTSLIGSVRFAHNNQPIAGALVRYARYSEFRPAVQGTVTTDANGNFATGDIFLNESDSVVVRAEVSGFEAVEITRNGAMTFANPVFNFLIQQFTVTRTPLVTRTATATRTRTGTPCPQPTPELLRVEPVTSPTNVFEQTVLIQASNALTVTVTTESGVFTLNPQPGAWQHAITITLLPGTTHHLLVTSHIRTTTSGGCVFGGYTLSTTVDRNGAPLTIVQQSSVTYTPTATSDVPTVTPGGSTLTPTPTGTPTVAPPGDLGTRVLTGTVRGLYSQQPIAGATITYSRFSYIHPYVSGTLTTDAQGRFSTPAIMLRDTDTVRIAASVPGYETLEIQRTGLQTFYNPRFEFDLRSFTPTVTGSTPTPSGSTPTPTATLCPQPTPELLRVEPVTSPTNVFEQTVLIQASNALTVTVTTESGVFTLNPQPGAWQHAITITLLPGTTHHLLVTSHVRAGTSGGCSFGGYTLSTTLDRTAAPLTIVQQTTSTPFRIFFPMLLR